MKTDLDRPMGEYATREPSPAAARGIAQQALEDADLFDALVAQGAVEASLKNPAVRAAVSVPARRKPWALAFYAAAAAAVLVALFWWRSSPKPIPAPSEQARVVVSKPAIIPSLDAASGRPVLLASELRLTRSSGAPVFRGVTGITGANMLSREPQAGGMITALEDGEATVNLGSLDGLTKGTELATPTGTIVVTTVFRDHARGTITSGAVRDAVQVPVATHLAAVLHEVDALAFAGDVSAARELARKTLSAGSFAETRMLLERLAALDYQAGAIDAAREHFEAAANNLFAPPAASPSEQAATLNSLGALYLLAGEPESAVKPLNQAAAQTGIHSDLRAQILNNLGVLAEMRGDFAGAQADYRGASAEKTSLREHNIAQANLARISNSKRP